MAYHLRDIKTTCDGVSGRDCDNTATVELCVSSSNTVLGRYCQACGDQVWQRMEKRVKRFTETLDRLMRPEDWRS